MVDFEGVEEKFRDAIASEAFTQIKAALQSKKRVFVAGNGGLHYVASHMATDLTRLVPSLDVRSFDSVGFITSNANDHGYDQLFKRWLETCITDTISEDIALVGLSCSGQSSNIINFLNYGIKRNYDCILISGIKNRSWHGIQLSFECKYYHTVETLSMMLFYEIIHSLGSTCPPISQ